MWPTSRSEELLCYKQGLLEFRAVKKSELGLDHMKPIVSGEGLSQNWMILLGHRRLQYIGEEPLGVAGG
jgi:hypothetical protein